MSRPHQERGEGDGCLVGLGGLDAPMDVKRLMLVSSWSAWAR